MKLASTFLGLAAADLPVHCLRHEVSGSWTFHLSEASSERSACGHLRPDDSRKQPKINLDQLSSKMDVHLTSPKVATSATQKGWWSMIYDEGFEVHLGETKFFAFSGFDESVEADGRIENYRSRCHETQVGWYHDTAQDKWGCWVGTKTDSSSMIQTSIKRMEITSGATLERAVSQAGTQAKVSLGEHRAHVEKINSAQSDWTATVYPNLLNLTRAELNEKSGIRRSGRSAPRQERASFLQTAASGEKVKQRLKSLPTDFDWRNKDGQDFVGGAVDQGGCGSCYVHAAVRMMSSRKRIQQGDPKGEGFSMQFPLFCSEYNQGCAGGFPELIAKWGQDVGLVPESCGQYDLSDQKCRLSCDLHQVEKWRVADYGYVSGVYGAPAGEVEMMEEVHERGPIAVAMEPTDDFMYYNKGIFSHAAVLFNEWARVDHAVLVTGWGEENGKKYWRVQNSWGPGWGEQGTFRIARGNDESAIEAQAVWATLEQAKQPGNIASYLQA